MDTKLRQILELALRSDTGEGESVAALNAARRLISKHGMDLLGAQAPERVVYRDRVVSKSSSAHAHSTVWRLTLPAAYTHTMIERVFLDAPTMGVEIELIKCEPQNKAILSGTMLEFKVKGTPGTVRAYSDLIQKYIATIKEGSKSESTYTPPPEPGPEPASKKSGGWKWFNDLVKGKK